MIFFILAQLHPVILIQFAYMSPYMQVKKKVVDSFIPRDKPRPSSLQLLAEALNHEERRNIKYPLSLKGTSDAKLLLNLRGIAGIGN